MMGDKTDQEFLEESLCGTENFSEAREFWGDTRSKYGKSRVWKIVDKIMVFVPMLVTEEN